MRSNSVQVKKRLPRIDRLEPIEVIEDENAHLWAISYSDFLMALLSFFILFFSLDENKKSALIISISEEFSRSGSIVSSRENQKTIQDSSSRTVATKENDMAENITKNYAHFFKDMDLQIKKENESLVIDFPPDYFANGKFQILGNQELLINKVLLQLKPYKENLNLYFEGHADDRPMHSQKKGILLDNFLLSSLRASSALSIAKQMGFKEKFMFIQAASSNLRNTRSISLRIVPHSVEGL
jgi:flagellar motor protein MotB